ncbi:zinc finger protein GLIS2 homolog [Drosophila subpulchrella]|uniref:zinc finger protein GLIS2 homolog n=1 Tax=Drosophila subpulchrella TaxID=1486046 RepID=UPI0018A1A09E|nr:zinc finger protein GLIS2 homolog [Drosophila subpulchrella]
MDIVQKSIFNSGPARGIYEPPVGYFTPYNTPPYIAGYTDSGSWLADHHLQQPHHQQMQHIRFPTPPITPPRPAAGYGYSQRTQSVIMKAQGQQDDLCRSPVEFQEDSKSCSSGSECGTSSDFVCNWIDCDRVFDTLEALAQHVTQRHAIASLTDGLYYCRWRGCQRSERGFNARYKMLVHTRTHTKEKPHRCHLCEKSFSRAENLKIHIRSHSGEKPYKCSFEGCQKAYSNSSDRFKHTRTHSMEKPYMCKVAGCQKRYTDPSSLRKHVKTFKHSIHLIASQPLSLPSAPCLLEASSESAFTCLPAVGSVESTCSSSSARYYDDSNNEPSDYSLKPKPDAEFSPSYWLNERQHSYLHSEDFFVKMDVESPLDLRIHRI